MMGGADLQDPLFQADMEQLLVNHGAMRRVKTSSGPQ